MIWIDHGTLVADGEPRKIIADYIDSSNRATGPREVGVYRNEGHRRGTGEVQFSAFRMLNDSGEEVHEFQMGDTLVAEVDFTAHADVESAVFSFSLLDAQSGAVVTTWVGRRDPHALSAGEQGTFRIVLPKNSLRARKYFLNLGVASAFNNDVPYDIWAGGGTEFFIGYPAELDDLDLLVGHDAALVTLPVRTEIEVAG